MELVVLFVVLIFWLAYILYSYLFKRLHLIYEISFVKISIIAIILALFPKILTFIDNVFGLVNLMIIILVIWCIVLFIIVFEMHRSIDKQRQEITTLTQEIAFLKNENKK